MFYSCKNQVVDHNLTYLNTQKVFTGQYWDEFALTCSLVPDQAKILMLGLSLGGGIRPIFASTKNIELTCVDYDIDSVERCRELFQDCFPNISFQSIIADAKEFLKNDTQSYDAIWFDIYDSAAYSNLSFDAEFLSLIQGRLSEKGVLLVNSYGLPNHFSPLTQNAVQHSFASHLKSRFDYVGTIPFRRNTTFIVSADRPVIFLAEAHKSLNPVDRFTFEFIQRKLLHQIPFTEVSIATEFNATETQFTTIDSRMRQCWSSLRERLNAAGFKLAGNSDFISLIQNEKQCEKVIRHLIGNDDLAVCFVPILASGESHMQELEIDWLFDWTEKNQQFLHEVLADRFELIWLTQLWALIIHPHGRYKKYYFRYLSLMQSL